MEGYSTSDYGDVDELRKAYGGAKQSRRPAGGSPGSAPAAAHSRPHKGHTSSRASRGISGRDLGAVLSGSAPEHRRGGAAAKAASSPSSSAAAAPARSGEMIASALADAEATGAAAAVMAGGSAAAAAGPEGGAGAATLGDAVARAGARERAHEIVALVGDQLQATPNLARMAAACDSSERALVVSFVGDTSAGKSHTIRALMGDGESRPYCQKNTQQNASTTYNVNLFPSRAATGTDQLVHFVDYEGENGTDTPLMAAARTLSMTAAGRASRHTAVVNNFPRLAYTTSDAVVVVSREPFFNRRYLTRCIEFAKRANAGVDNVDAPALILIGNQLPGEECVTDIAASTAQFFRAWGAEAKQLELYFSGVICVYMPNRRAFWYDDDDNLVDGGKVFAAQVRKVRGILRHLAEQQVAADAGEASTAGAGAPRARLMTARTGLWFALLPMVLREMNAQRGVDVSALVDEAWAREMAGADASEEELADVLRAVTATLRPPRELSLRAPSPAEDVLARFDAFAQLSLAVAARLTGCRLRLLSRELRVDSKLRRFAAHTHARVMELLSDLAPCAARYEGPGTATVRPDDSVLCAQEARHHRCHRTSRAVRGGGTGLWGTLSSLLAYNDVWEGPHEAPALSPSPQAAFVRQVLSTVVVEHAGAPASARRDALLALQKGHSSARIAVGFVLLSSDDFAGGAERARETDVDASVINASAGVTRRLRLGPASARAALPYCVGCGSKVNQLAPSGSSGGAGLLASALGAVMAAFGRGGDGDGDGAFEEAESEAVEAAHAAFTIAGPEYSRFMRPAGEEAPPVGGAAASTEEDEAPPRQHVWLGLCDGCWHGVRTCT